MNPHALDALRRAGNWVWTVCSCGHETVLRRRDCQAFRDHDEHRAKEAAAEWECLG